MVEKKGAGQNCLCVKNQAHFAPGWSFGEAHLEINTIDRIVSNISIEVPTLRIGGILITTIIWAHEAPHIASVVSCAEVVEP